MDASQTAQNDWLDAVLAEYERPLLRYVLSFTHDLETARDVVQDAFIRLFRTANSQQVTSPGPWLYKVCRNRAIDVLRQRSHTQPLDTVRLNRQQAPVADPSAAALQADDMGSVLEIVAALPANQQEVVRLRFQAGLSYKEISAVAKLSVSNVGYLLHHAIRNIRSELQRRERLTAEEPAR